MVQLTFWPSRRRRWCRCRRWCRWRRRRHRRFGWFVILKNEPQNFFFKSLFRVSDQKKHFKTRHKKNEGRLCLIVIAAVVVVVVVVVVAEPGTHRGACHVVAWFEVSACGDVVTGPHILRSWVHIPRAGPMALFFFFLPSQGAQKILQTLRFIKDLFFWF